MATLPGDAEFTSKLDEASKKKAKEELNELNDADRALAVQTFRKWILEQDCIKSPTDFEFLLRYLRARKFSQLGARQTLENYWTSKTTSPDWFKDVDPCDPNLIEILKSGYLLSPKVYDSNGRRLIMDRPGRLKDDIVERAGGSKSVFKTIGLFIDWVLTDENVQVNGVNVIADLSDVKLSSLTTLWTAENGKKLLSFYQHSAPVRIKQMHFYNEPIFFDAVFALMKPLIKQKMRDRLFLHGGSMVDVFKEVEKCILPAEYLPDDYTGPNAGPISKIIDDMIEEMTQPGFRSYMKKLSSGEFKIDLDKKKSNDIPSESFRKLNVD
ncbi:alpha-tocopherol transfer protein-like [Mercenaria mercenaria]|uniref:alpha-tocopherol transfer protein-like n=1 Tax=Mercenaria mercenaria TaxID=6596 RepID=UPI00234EB361|nr:alpha-tocopherol transfer protein-like [Mercenaria mercenaria]